MSKLSIEQITLLQNRMANIKDTEKKAIKRLGYKENIELSYSQKRLWFMYQMDPDNPVYNIPKILRLDGELNINALEQSLGKIIERHEVLRTIFINREGDPRQYVKNYQGFKLPIIKIDGENIEDRRRACLDFLREDIHQGFDLVNGPVFRAGLYCISETEHVLALVIHHIVSDGWSHQVLFKELSELYNSFSKGESSRLEELPVQYADFAVWQKESLEKGSTTEKSLEYWKNNLKHSLPLLEIPTDYKRKQVQDFDGDVETISVPINIIYDLRLFNKRIKSSMFMTMLAAFKVLLYRYTNEEDILVGTANAGREEAELEQLIGFFVNNLVLRTNVTNQLTFNELCQKVKDTMLMAFEHQNIPFEKLVEELQPERNLSYNPIYQVYFTYQKDYWSGASLDNLIVTPVNLNLKTSKVDLSMHVEEYSDEMFVHIEFKTSLYKPATIKRLLEHFLIVLEGAIKNPEQQIGNLPILTNEQYFALIQKEHHKKTDSNRSACVHQIFEMQAKRMPNRVAISYENQQLTYGELNIKANQLAHYLINQGVGPELKVGICLDRSLEMVISILGILKAGGAYVPLDPHVPSDRLSFIIKDSEVPIIITSSSLKQKLPSDNVKTILLDTKQNDLKNEALENPITNVSGNNLAYIIYTSGSTGKPKGVLIEHSNVTRLFDSTSHWYKFTENDVWTMFHSYAFDFSVWELWGALLYGGKLIIVPYLISRSPEDFYNLLLEEKVTVLNQTPSAFRQIIDFISRKKCENELYLRYVIFGGEALELNTLIPWIEIYDDSRPKLVNMYGITETTVHTTYRVITKEDIDNGLGSVIGEAIPDLQLYVLNKSLHPVPMGVIGELYIGGAGVARSYHNQAELTSERFITNPFSKNRQDKLYRTGDLVRYISDKDLEYHGRIDNQVKIRGFRIELGEIQSALESHDCVKEAAILVKEEKLGDRRLIGFVNTKQDISASTLRSFLKGVLPEYMIPSIVFVPSLPLTENGKLDTKELLAVPSQMAQEEIYLAPSTSTEKKVANIFSEYLGVLRVSVNESFFEMGGHSLLATQVVSRINDMFQIHLPLRTFFEKTTVDQLAQEIDFQMTKETNHSLPMIRRDRRQPIPLSYAQQRLYFLNKLDTDNTSYQIPLPLRLKGTLNIKILESVLHKLIERHETLRTTIKEIDGKPYQVIHDPHQQPLAIQDLSLLHEENKATELERILKEEWDWKFDLEEGPLFRYYLLRLSNEEHILVAHTHHMFTDGWSLGIFVQELIELYSAFSQNKPNPLRPLEYQYADFSMWQRELLEGGTLEKQLRYWKNKLDGDISVFQLPDAKIRKENIESKGEKIEITLSRTLSQNLKTLSKNENTTLFMTFIAAFKVLLGRLSGQDDILIGIPIANRNYSNIEQMIGFFVNTLVLRTRINNNQTFLDVLKDVRISSLDAYSNQDIPFEKLVEELPLERNINNNPLFEVMVNYHNPEVEKVSGELPGLKIEEIPLPTSKSKFQMTLHIFEQEEIYIQLVYRPDLFSALRIKEILEQFEYLLEQIVSNANKTIGSYSLVTESMKSSLPNPIIPLQELEFPMITRLIDDWSLKTPDKVAIHYKKQSWTYKQLKNHSDAIAKELLKRGLKKGEVVTLVGDRSFGFYASMVGIFKSGGVMLAIDQNQSPIERQRLMINQANASYIVYVSNKPLGEIFDYNTLEIIYVHAEAGLHIDYNISLPTISPNDAAYICFTSGSTGVPKAILGRHIGLNYGLHYLRTKFSELSVEDRFSQLVYVSFDYIFREVFLPLTCGATLCLPDDPYDLSPDKILSWLVEKDITVVATVPSLAAFWITYAEENLRLKKAIKVTFFAGEPLFDTLVSRWRNFFGGEIVNAYGPSETTMAVAYKRVSEKNDIGIQSPGKPMPGVQTLILNEQNQLCSIGELGQIAIRSPYRTLGYLNMPEENKQKFVPNPFNLNSKDDLVYLTGDLGYYSQNGDINVTGRMDFQVKVRGLRIELNEIVTTLLKHEAVDNCIVIDHKNDKEETFLVAYVVKKVNVDKKDLFRFLSEKLMPAMVPAVFVFLDELPLLPNGKVDRRNLPAAAAKKSHYSVQSADYVQSRNSVELQIASVWKKILNLDFVGIYDNFFEIGGHSMKAMEIMHELRKCFNCDLPLRVFIESPTVEKLALAVTMYKPEERKKCLVPLQYDNALEDQSPLFLIHPVGGSVLCYLPLVKELGTNINIYGIQSFGIESEDPAFENVSDMADLYISEILKVAPRGPYRLAAWSFGVLVLYEIAQRIEEMGETIEFLGFIDYLPMHKELISTPKEHVSKVLLSNLNIDHAVLQGLTEDEGLELTMEYVKKELSPERGETIEAVQRAVKVMVGNGIARDVFQLSGPLKSDVHLYCVTERAPIAPTPIIKEEDAKNLTTGKIHFYKLPGNHHNICNPPFVKNLARTMKDGIITIKV